MYNKKILKRVTGAGSIAAGARSLSVVVTGTTDVLVDGETMRPGEYATWTCETGVLDALVYDCGAGGEMLVSGVA